MSEVVDMPVRDTRRRAVRVRAGSLRAALKDVLGAVAGRSELPILDHVVMTAGDGAISLESTDLDMWIRRELASDDRDGAGSADWVKSIRGFSVAVPAKPLDKILAGVDADAMATIAVETDEGAPDDLTDGYGGQVTVSAGRARFRLACLPPAEFPRAAKAAWELEFDMDAGGLADVLARVSHAVSSEETRYYLNGVLWHVWQEDGHGAELRFAATDGNRLARLGMDVPEGAMALAPTIVHRRTVALLEKLLPQAVKAAAKDAPAAVSIARDGSETGGLMRFAMDAADGGAIEIVAKSIDGTFPDYARVIPASTVREATLPRGALSEAARRISALSEEKSRALKLALSADAVTLRAAVPGLGSAEEALACRYEGEGFEIGFNVDYLRTALGAIAADDVVVGFVQDSVGPVTVRASGGDDDDSSSRLLQVLMPMRVA
ncbi:DNA polymerase III subunit beta [Croceicoccus gelatinilyticus]|uniref:DNA polymerase III subunit beta n=1 Tax=Croceicoccus gelatinilyticus TaxID=2835536 RepID=UPI001CEC93A6|nr:DNA polymerase III subunit beta [Croceicoccus gelatinilyticus]